MSLKLSAHTDWLRSASAAIQDVAESIPTHKLSSEERRMALLCRQSHNKTSWVAPILFLCSSLGKLILGFGASLAVKGHYSKNKSSLIAGAVLAGLGLCGCVAAAIGFGAAASKVNSRRGLAFKIISISGACLIGVGYALNQLYVSTSKPGQLERIRLSFIPLMIGCGLMCISLPNFTAYTELLRGRLPFIPIARRRIVALGSMSPALGLLFAGWVTGEHSQWPPAFNATLLTFAIALALVGVSINWSDNLRIRSELLERILCKEEEYDAMMLAKNSVRTASLPKRSPLDPEKLSPPTSTEMQNQPSQMSVDTTATLAEERPTDKQQ